MNESTEKQNRSSIYAAILVASAFFIFYAKDGHAETCQQPSPQPDVAGTRYKALQKNAAYAVFMADECGFDNDIQKKYNALVKTIFDDQEDQRQGMEEFKSKKHKFSDEAGFLSIKKSCYLDTGKTRALVNEASDDISSYMDEIITIRQKYQKEVSDWNNCQAQERAAQKAKAEQTTLEEFAKFTVEKVQESAQDLLDRGWPNAAGMLRPQRTSLVKKEMDGSKYFIVARLHYLNILKQPQYVDVEFTIDPGADKLCVQFGDYSDAAAHLLFPLRQLSCK